jgi:hypothetical protein
MPTEISITGGLPALDENGQAVTRPCAYAHDGDGEQGERFIIEDGESISLFIERVRTSTSRRFLVWSWMQEWLQ